MQTASYEEADFLLTVECASLLIVASDDASLNAMLENKAISDGLSNWGIFTDAEKKWLRGNKTIFGKIFTIHVYVFKGNESLLMVTAAGVNTEFPQPAIVNLIDSVQMIGSQNLDQLVGDGRYNCRFPNGNTSQLRISATRKTMQWSIQNGIWFGFSAQQDAFDRVRGGLLELVQDEGRVRVTDQQGPRDVWNHIMNFSVIFDPKTSGLSIGPPIGPSTATCARL